MKRLLTLILLLSGLIVQAQNPVVINQPYNFTKYLITRDSLKITHAPSLLDSSDKAITSAWIKQQTFAGGAGVNIYNSDGTLSGNRIVNLNKNNINWIGGNNFGIEANNEFYVEDSNNTKTLYSDGLGRFTITDKLSGASTFDINKYGGLFAQNVIHGNNTITSYGGGDFQLNNGRTNAVTMKIDSNGSANLANGNFLIDSVGNVNTNGYLSLMGGNAGITADGGVNGYDILNGASTLSVSRDAANFSNSFYNYSYWEAYSSGEVNLYNSRTRLNVLHSDSTGAFSCGSGTTGLKTIQVDSLGNTKIRSLQLLDSADNVFARLKYTNGHYVNHDYTTGLDSIIAYQGATVTIDSTIWQTKYRSDTNRVNVYNAIASLNADSVYQAAQIALRVKYTDTATMLSPYLQSAKGVKYTDTASLVSPYLRKSDTATMLANRLKISDTLTMLDNRVSSITLNSSGVLHSSPITFTRLGGAWSGQMTLASQSAYKVFWNNSNTTTMPSYNYIDTPAFGGLFNSRVQSSLTANGLNASLYYNYLASGYVLSVNASSVTNTTGSALTIQGGAANGTSRGGALNLYGGVGGSSGTGTITIGASIGTSPSVKIQGGTDITYGGPATGTILTLGTNKFAFGYDNTNNLLKTTYGSAYQAQFLSATSYYFDNYISSTQYRLSALNTAPSSSTDVGVLGEIRVTSTYIYICTATNTWVRTALSTF